MSFLFNFLVYVYNNYVCIHLAFLYMVCIYFLYLFYMMFISFSYRHHFIQLALHTPWMKRMSGIQSAYSTDKTINSVCYHYYKQFVGTKCIPKQDGTDLHIVLDCSTPLLHFKPSFICHGIGHKKQVMKYMYWTKPEHRLYYNKRDQLVDTVPVWTPRTPQQVTDRGRFAIRKQITHRCLTQLMAMVLNC